MESQKNGFKKYANIIMMIIVIAIIAIGAFLIFGKNKDQEAALLKSAVVGAPAPAPAPLGTVAAPAPSLRCSTMDTTPRIGVMNPNGGEVYQSGEQVLVKWSSCNVAATQQVVVALQSSLGTRVNLVTTANDGTESVTIPATTSGKFYRVALQLVSNTSVSDVSDNLFTINNPASPAGNSVLLITPVLSQSELVPAGGGLRSRALLRHTFKVKNTSNQTLWINCEISTINIENQSGNVGGTGETACVETPVMNGWGTIAAGAEIPMVSNHVFKPSATGSMSLRGTLAGVSYKTSQNGAIIMQPPQAHPQFQSTWTLTTPFVSI